MKTILIGIFLVIVVCGLVIWSIVRILADFERDWPPAGSEPLDPPERFGDGGEA